MQSGVQGLEPASDLERRIRAMSAKTPEETTRLKEIDWTLSEITPLLDSANITPADWQTMADTCFNNAQAEGIVIVHGTDTLAYSACALAYLLSGITIPVIITGSQKPLEARGSDALGNFNGALLAAASAPPGAWVYFDNRLLPAARTVKKNALAYDGFDAPKLLNDFHPGSIVLNKQASPKPWETLNIPIAHLCPGFHAAQMLGFIDNKPQAVVLALYGLGTLANQNRALIDALQLAQQKDIVIVAVSQCYISRIDFTQYAAGAELEGLGVVSGLDMTLEAAYTKLMVLFHLGYSNTQIRRMLNQSIAGEINCSDE